MSGILRRGIIHRPLALVEEFEHRPIIWNPGILDARGHQLGVRTHIGWAAWDRGPAASLQTWLSPPEAWVLIYLRYIT